MKRRKVMMKSYDHCFTGADAVDVVLHQLLTDKDSFPNKDITRDKAVKVSSSFLRTMAFSLVCKETIGLNRKTYWITYCHWRE